MLDTATYRSCPNCEGTDCTPWAQYSPEDWEVVKCIDCDMTYLRNPVTYEALKEDFAWEKTYVEKTEKGGSTRLSSFARKLRTSTIGLSRDNHSKYRKWFNDGAVLDIGCGSGHRVKDPMTPYGIELSNELHAQADAMMRNKGGYCAHGAGADAIWEFEPSHFDGILMFSYLEHETDVLSVLRGAHRALKDTGAVFIRVPNFGSLNRHVVGSKWCGFRYPDHVNYFTLSTLRNVAKRTGFDTTLINRATFMVDDNIHVLLRKSARS
ncbi:MAG: SAM-dependent methyltransferase [Candidatus Azotimanducaceae bacterium]|jgi:SAM-dependent methyltransferase